MFSFLPANLRGIISVMLYFVNTFFWCIPLYIVAIVKLILPLSVFRKGCDILLIAIASAWVYGNSINLKLMHSITWRISGRDALQRRQWYLVVANHQSWVDILVLQHIFHGHIPFLKFFLKKELIWVPLLGLAWWALDFPFMKRYSAKFLQKHPHLKGKDIEITRKACEKFKSTPISIMNFLEGTRFTDQKHSRQSSPYTHLLRPKAGGVAFVLAAMGESLNSILDVTIVYPEGRPSFWDLVCGRVTDIRVDIKAIPINDSIRGDYFEDDAFKDEFQTWINSLWEMKDARISGMLKG